MTRPTVTIAATVAPASLTAAAALCARAPDVKVSSTKGQLAVRVNEKAATALRPDVWTSSYWKLADGKYHNYALSDWLCLHRRPYRLEIASRPKGKTRFKPLPVRWVVERTYAWQGRYRGLSKDYEHTPKSSETTVRIAAIHHLLQRLRPKEEARSQRFRFKRHRKRAA